MMRALAAAATVALLAGCAAKSVPDAGGTMILSVDRSRRASGSECACGETLDPVMERLRGLAAVREARADWAGRHVLVRLAPGTRVEEIDGAMADVHPPARRLDAAAEKECLARTAMWLTDHEAARLSRREAKAIAERYAKAAAARAKLDDRQRGELETLLADRLGTLFERCLEAGMSVWGISEEFLGAVLSELRARYWPIASAEQTLAIAEELKSAVGMR